MDYGALIQMVVSLVGEENAKKMNQKQLDLLAKQLADMKGIKVPELQNITPEQLGPSAYEGLQSDPASRQAEEDTLAEYGNIADSGGLDFRTKAALNDVFNDSESRAQAGQQSIRQSLQGTGQLGSGADIAMRMGNASSAANRAGDAALQQAAIGEQRKMDALQHKGSLASSMRGEDWNEKMKRAAAHDAREEWNAASRSKAGYYNAGLPQQQFNNQVTKVTGSFAPGSNLAAAYGNEAQGQRSLWSGLGAGAHQAWDSASSSDKGGGGQGQGGPIGYDNSGTPYYSNPDEWEGW